MAISIAAAKPGDLLVDDTNTIIAIVQTCGKDKLCTALDMDDRRWVWHLHRVDTSRDTLPVPSVPCGICSVIGTSHQAPR